MHQSGKSGPRRRKTVTLDITRIQDWLDVMTRRVLEQVAACTSVWVEQYSETPDFGGVQAQLLGHLKAFLDAARPAGGLPTDRAGRPVHLDRLLAAGRANTRAGEVAPRLLAKVRSGKPVDLRMAEAVLTFFRCVLERPGLTLDDLGAVEAYRLQVVQRIESAIRAGRDELPARVYEGLALRAQEAAGYATLLDDVVYEYRSFEHFVDARGVHRLRALRVLRYRPVRLTGFAGLLRPSRAFEWHEWSHVETMQLRLWLLDSQGRRVREFQPPLRKRIDDERGIIVFHIEPHAAAELVPHLALPAAGELPYSHELEWQETMIFNVADRDIVVSYAPMNRPRIVFDAAAHPGLRIRVGDSPGLQRTADGWQLDRVLMPREVLAVRFRLSVLTPGDAAVLSPSGDWLSSAAPLVVLSQ